jgi:hypothetical protein
MSSYAVRKLICQESTRTIQDTPSEALLAVLSQRFALDVLFGSQKAVSFISKSVASYMRILLSTTEDRLWQWTTYPSEPVLSHAAAEVMYTREESLGHLLGVLSSKILSGLINAGEFGELLGRLLILISRDFAAIRIHEAKISGSFTLSDAILSSISQSVPFPDSGTKSFPYLLPVPLLDVLSILFGHECLFGSEKKPAEKELIKSTFARAYVSFSHWVVFTQNTGPFPETLTYVMFSSAEFAPTLMGTAAVKTGSKRYSYVVLPFNAAMTNL